MLGCFKFNPNLGKIWTNPNVGLKLGFNFHFELYIFNCIFNLTFGFVYILSIYTTQHFLECRIA